MGQKAIGRDRMAFRNIAAEIDYGGNLGRGIGWHVVLGIMAGMNDFDPDRPRIEIGLALPIGFAGMPGPPTLGNQLDDAAVFEDEIMAGH